MGNIVKVIHIFVFIIILTSCGGGSSSGTSGVSSVSGYRVGISAIYSGVFLPSDGISQAIIRVEVWNRDGDFVDNVPVILAVTIGTLESSSLITVSGVASTTFTSLVNGNATVTALVENVTAKATVVVRDPIVL